MRKALASVLLSIPGFDLLPDTANTRRLLDTAFLSSEPDGTCPKADAIAAFAVSCVVGSGPDNLHIVRIVSLQYPQLFDAVAGRLGGA
jgi:hypothetical protein